MIIARRMTVIQKNGFRTDYTHVQSISTVDDYLLIEAETGDNNGPRQNVHDQFKIAHLEHTYIDWFIPKV